MLIPYLRRKRGTESLLKKERRENRIRKLRMRSERGSKEKKSNSKLENKRDRSLMA